MTSHESGQDSITSEPRRAGRSASSGRGMDADTYFELLGRADEVNQDEKRRFKDRMSMEQVIQRVLADQVLPKRGRPPGTRNKSK